MGKLSICLLGRFRVLSGAEVVPGFDARRVQELFGYLLLQSGRPQAREPLASLLWGETTTVNAKKHLRQALWQLQNALDEYADDSDPPFLLVDAEWVQVNPEALLAVDVEQFQNAFQTVRGIRGSELSDEQCRVVRTALAMYRGDLLNGWYQEWCLYRRERYQNMQLAMLDKLMGYCEARQAYEEGVQHGDEILAIDYARERAHRRLMRLRYLSGDRTGALRQYQQCSAALRAELGVQPAQSTQELYEHIKKDRHAAILLHGQPALSSTSLPPSLRHLRQLQALLAKFQSQIRHEIQSMENLIDRS